MRLKKAAQFRRTLSCLDMMSRRRMLASLCRELRERTSTQAYPSSCSTRARIGHQTRCARLGRERLPCQNRFPTTELQRRITTSGSSSPVSIPTLSKQQPCAGIHHRTAQGTEIAIGQTRSCPPGPPEARALFTRLNTPCELWRPHLLGTNALRNKAISRARAVQRV